MKIVNPDRMRLNPGQSLEAIYEIAPEFQRIGFFVRSALESIERETDISINLRAGLVKYNGVLLVFTIMKLGTEIEEFFDIWWNYYSADAQEHFRRIAEQEKLTVHIYDDNGIKYSIDCENTLKRFFETLRKVIEKHESWTEVEYERALRAFCAQNSKESFWEMTYMKYENPSESYDDSRYKHGIRTVTIDDYSGYIPEDLRSFYLYVPGTGHCISVIPSMLESDVLLGDPEEHVYPAPIKTVLRCGYRWMKGFPIVPVPFIPGHGLAFPPEDNEY